MTENRFLKGISLLKPRQYSHGVRVLYIRHWWVDWDDEGV